MSETSKSTKKTIMLADDDPFILEIYTAKLTREGFNVVSVGDGEEAILKIDSIQPDLLILDMNMPRMDGVEVLRYIRSSVKHGEMPVVVLSNAVTDSMMKDIWELKPTRLLTKRQSRPNNVLAEIQAVLNGIEETPSSPPLQAPPKATVVSQQGHAKPSDEDAPAAAFDLKKALQAIDLISAAKEQEQRQQALLISYKLSHQQIESLRKGDPRNTGTQFARLFEEFYDCLYSHPELISYSACRTLQQASEMMAKAVLASQLKEALAPANMNALLAVEDSGARGEIADWLEHLELNVVCTRDFSVAVSLADDNSFDLAVIAAGKAGAAAKIRKKLIDSAKKPPARLMLLLSEGQLERVGQEVLAGTTDMAAMPAEKSEIALKIAMIKLAGKLHD